MKKRIGWLILSCLMALSLVLASCAPAVTEEEEEEEDVVVEEEEEEEEEEVTEEEKAPVATTPQYGGTINLVRTSDFVGFDPAYTVTWQNYQYNFTHDKMAYGDQTRGPGGTGETGFLVYTFNLQYQTGYLAESWEFPDDGTIIFHIRPGVRWQNKAPVNGREVTADDVVYSFERLFVTPESYLYTTHPEGKRPTSIKALDKYTVEVKVPAINMGPVFRDLSSQTWTIAPEIVEKYGDHKNWKNVVGNGPFMIEDYIPMSSMTYVRNPDYWMEDALYPGNQLPYVDKFKWLIIADLSTRLAALRTGKIEQMRGIEWEDKDNLLNTNPDLQWQVGGSYEDGMGWRIDTPPFDDIRVRKALWLGMDNQAITDDYYGGNAYIHAYPIRAVPDFQAAYTPLEELDAETQELFEYKPEKAMELLAEAGYPDGFTFEVICRSSPAWYAEKLEVLKAQWTKIGVDMEIKPMEYGAWNSMSIRKQHKQANYADSLWTSSPFKCQTWETDKARNLSIIADPWLDEKAQEIQANFLNAEKRNAVIKEVTPYLLKNAFYLTPPVAYSFTFWQPWLHGYSGEYCTGYTSFEMWVRFAWLDLDMKEAATGRR